MKKLRSGLVGLGRVGWPFHFPQLLEKEGFDFLAVTDMQDERLAEAKSKAPHIRCYKDFNRMIDEEELDLVVIASPTGFHFEQVKKAFEAGVDVFLEKPMAVDLAEADRMIELMHKHGRKLMVYQPHRKFAHTVKAKEIIESGLLGNIYMIKHETSLFRFRSDWQSMKKYGGGMVNNYGAHFIDLLLYLSNSKKAVDISCHLRRIASVGDADDVVKLTMVSDNNTILDLDINCAAAVSNRPLIVYGDCGTLWLEKNVLYIKYFDPEIRKEFSIDESLAAAGRKYDLIGEPPWQEKQIQLTKDMEVDYYDKCYEYFALDQKPFVDVRETREVMRIIQECKDRSEIWGK
jgi:scyllo-inositol 2-dehydrogenase (NADP+)